MKNNKKIIFIFILIIIFSPIKNRNIFASNSFSEEIEEIQKQIKAKEQKINDLKNQKEFYQDKIDIKRDESVTLKNQIDILKIQIFKSNTEIQQQEVKIDSKNLSIKNIQYNIEDNKKEIINIKASLSNILQTINSADEQSFVEIILFNDSISAIFNSIRYLNSLQSKTNHFLKQIKFVKQGLEIQEKNLRVELNDLIDMDAELINKKSRLSSTEQTKKNILAETQGAEWKFQSLLAEILAENKQIENEIASMEREIRAKLAKEESGETLMDPAGIIIFSWPVTNRGITSRFHDPDYPYRNWIGEHSGLDLRASQGTLIRAPASGYVAKTRNAGLGYSYLLLVHNDDFSTLYGHVSEFLVEEGEYIKRGQGVARTGGMPGTYGAGRFSTGPHLHFEVRLNGMPVNPEDYLL